MSKKILIGSLLAVMIFSVGVFAVSAAETKDRMMYIQPVQTYPGETVPYASSVPQRQTATKTELTEEQRLRKEEQEVDVTNTWNLYVKQKNQEMEAKRKELLSQKKTMEQQVKTLQTSRQTERKTLLAECKYQKLTWPEGTQPTAEEYKASVLAERERVKACLEKVKAFDLETRKKVLEIKKGGLQAEKTVLGISTEVPYTDNPAFPW